MEYVRMPELLSPEVVRVLAENAAEIRSMMDSDIVAESNASDNQLCPKKIKFIIFLDNVVIININAAAEEENDD